MKITRWTCEICECVIEFQWDETLSEDVRTHSYSNTVKTCSSHAGVTGSQLWDALQSETQRKEYTRDWILQNVPNVSIEKTDESGNVFKEFKPEITYDWNFEGVGANRILNTRLLGIQLSDAEKTSIQNFADIKFGTNKVVVI